MVFKRLSVGVRPASPRTWERRVKRTSVGIWRRDCVREKMFSGAKMGIVLIMNTQVTTKRRKSARATAGGTSRMGMPCVFWLRIDL